MANRKKPTNKELLDMLLYLRKMMDDVTKLSRDTAFILKTYINMKNDDKALFREIRKTHENDKKNTAVKQNVESKIKGVINVKEKTSQTGRADQANR